MATKAGPDSPSASVALVAKPRLGACRLAASDRADPEVSDEVRALPDLRNSRHLAGADRAVLSFRFESPEPQSSSGAGVDGWATKQVRRIGRAHKVPLASFRA